LTEKGLKDFIQDLTNDNPIIRRKAANMLGELQNIESVDELIQNLNDEDNTTKKAIIRALHLIGDAKAIEPLLELFKNETNTKIKALIAWALGHFSDDDFDLSNLSEALDEDNDYLKLNIIFALGNKKFTKSVPKLIEILENDKNISIRKKTIWALGQMEDQKALQPLITSLNDNSFKIRRKSASILTWFPYTKTKITELLKTLDNHNHPGRAEVIHILGKQTSNLCVPKLIELFENHNEHYLVRKKAIEALGRLKDARAYKTIANAIKDPSQSIRVIAIRSLNHDHNLDIETLQTILDAIKDDNEKVRKEALKFIRSLISSSYYPIELINSIPTLIDLLFSDIDDIERSQIVEILSRTRDERIIEPFQKIVKNYPGRAKSTAFHTLEKMGVKLDIQPFFDDLNNPSIDVRRSALVLLSYSEQLRNFKELIREGLYNEEHLGHLELIYLLRHQRTKNITKALVNIAKNNTDSLTRQEAMWQAVRDTSSSVIELLKELIDDEDENISKSAMYLLHTKFPKIKIDRPDIPTSINDLFPKKKKKSDIPREDKNDVLKLLDLLQNNSNRRIRWRAAIALKNHSDDDRIIKPLISALEEEYNPIRVAATYALSKTKNIQVTEPLIAALKDPSKKVRKSASFGLRNLPEDDSLEDSIIEELKVKNHIGRADLIRVFVKKEFVKSIPTLLEIVKHDDDFKVKRMTLSVLSSKKEDQILDVLITTVNDPIREIRLAAPTNSRYGPFNISSKKDYLLKIFKDKTSFGRYEAFQNLCGFSRSESLVNPEFILEALHDDYFYIRRLAVVMFDFHGIRHKLFPKGYNKLRKTHL